MMFEIKTGLGGKTQVYRMSAELRNTIWLICARVEPTLKRRRSRELGFVMS